MFSVDVERRDPQATVTIAGPGLDRAWRVHRYVLAGDSQPAFVQLHAAVARDFGTRMLQTRVDTAAGHAAAIAPLLTTPVDCRILYGYGDPAVVRLPSGAYYAVVTSNDAPDAFPILRSATLQDWCCAGFVFPAGTKPTWAAVGRDVSDFWAPEMHVVRGEVRVYFAARQWDGTMSIGVATAARPEGPFTPGAAPLIAGNVIDPNVLVTDAGAFLYWKEDTNGLWPSLLAATLHAHPDVIDGLFTEDVDRRTARLFAAAWPHVEPRGPMHRFFWLQPLIEAVVAEFTTVRKRLADVAAVSAEPVGDCITRALHAMTTRILAQRLTDDGTALCGERHVVLENDQPWEGHLIEGTWVVAHDGGYTMFYSGNDFSTPAYGIGVAVAKHPLGPFVKMEEPLLRTSREWVGPGHPSVAREHDGTPRLFFHAYRPGEIGYKQFRALLSARIAFTPQGAVLRE